MRAEKILKANCNVSKWNQGVAIEMGRPERRQFFGGTRGAQFGICCVRDAYKNSKWR